MTRYIAFRYPTGTDVWTDEAIAGLVGQSASVALHDVEMGPGIVTGARRDERPESQNPLGINSNALWIEMEIPYAVETAVPVRSVPSSVVQDLLAQSEIDELAILTDNKDSK